jgi:chaperone BCS1
VGYGNHIFFYKRRIFYLSRIEKDVNNTTDTKESLYITTYGWSPESIRRFLQDVIPQPVGDQNTHIHAFDDYWRRSTEKGVRNLSTVVLTDSNEKKLRDHITQYLDDKAWYRKHKIPWRTGIVLEGPPGTGKTTISLALCGEFNSHLFIANLALTSDERLLEMFKSLPPRAIILIEDIDSYSVATSRSKKMIAKKDDKKSLRGTKVSDAPAYDDERPDASDFSFGSLSGLLNAIDGICSTEDRILIATTNHVEKLDPALIREGRFELILKIDYLDDETARKMFAKFYPDFKMPANFKMRSEISPAKFQTMAMGNKSDPQFIFDFCNEKATKRPKGFLEKAVVCSGDSDPILEEEVYEK